MLLGTAGFSAHREGRYEPTLRMVYLPHSSPCRQQGCIARQPQTFISEAPHLHVLTRGHQASPYFPSARTKPLPSRLLRSSVSYSAPNRFETRLTLPRTHHIPYKIPFAQELLNEGVEELCYYENIGCCSGLKPGLKSVLQPLDRWNSTEGFRELV